MACIINNGYLYTDFDFSQRFKIRIRKRLPFQNYQFLILSLKEIDFDKIFFQHFIFFLTKRGNW